MFYLLKKGCPEFSPGDGHFRGHEFRHGKKYPAEDVPPEYLDWFDPVALTGLGTALVAGARKLAEIREGTVTLYSDILPQEEPNEAENDLSINGEEDIINA